MDAHKSSPLRPGLHRLAGIAFDQCSMDVHKAAASADPVYINSPVRAGLQHQCRLSPSAPAYNAAVVSSVRASFDATVLADGEEKTAPKKRRCVDAAGTLWLLAPPSMALIQFLQPTKGIFGNGDIFLAGRRDIHSPTPRAILTLCRR